MKDRTMKVIAVCGLTLFLGVFSLSISGQSDLPCRVEGTRRPKFRIATLGGGDAIVRGVVVKPRYQNDENLLLLAKYFAETYCKANEILIAVFDTEKAAREFKTNGVPTIPDTLRATYHLNRKKRQERLVRVKVVNNAQVELPITLN